MAGRALLGRTSELVWLISLGSAAGSGHSSTNIIEGDPGVGETALLDAATKKMATDLAVVSIAGVEAEVDLPFGTLQRLVLTYRSAAEKLPEQHRSTLLVTTGLEKGVAGDRLSIGMALLSLFSRISEPNGAFVWVDDAHWVDPDSLATIAFVARRILADRMALVFTRRPYQDDRNLLTGLPVRHLGGLDLASAIDLLERGVGRPVERLVAERITKATGGNPLALLDLGAELTPPQVEGTALLPDPMPLGTHLQQHYARQILSLPPDTRRWLLLAAAEPDGDFALVATAGADAELPLPASSAAEQANLVAITDRVTFRHPLIRSAVYGAATREERRTAHHHLSRAAHSRGATTRSLLHRAAAIDGVDAALADQLEAAALAAAAHANEAARTDLLIQSAHASPPGRRAMRLLRAAQSALWAGAIAQAKGLLAEIDDTELDEPGRLTVELVAGDLRIKSLDNDAFAGRAAAFLRVSEMLDRCGRRRDALISASMAIRSAWDSQSQSRSIDDTDIARSMLQVARRNDDAQPVSLSVRTLCELMVGDPQHGVDAYRTAVDAYTQHVTADQDYLSGFAGVVGAAGLLLDDLSRDRIMAAVEKAARAGAGRYILCNIVTLRCNFDLQSGRLGTARARLAEIESLLNLIGYPIDYPPLVAARAAMRGWTSSPPIEKAELHRNVAECERIGYGAGIEQWRRAWVGNRIALGEYTEAAILAADLAVHTATADGFLLGDLIEIAARTGQITQAQKLRCVLETRGARLPTATYAGLLCWADAFIGDDSETAFRGAIHHFENADATLYTGRAHLALGEWLRRRRRRNQAQTHLRTAAQIFSKQGATGWAQRAGRELAPLGVVAPKGAPAPGADLTPQEWTVARFAAEGATNGDIAERLYLSPSTVDYHLRKVFRKLGVTSRRQLRTTLT